MKHIQHCIIIALTYSILFSGIHNTHAQQTVAQQAYAVLEQNCIDCHGEFGSYADALVIGYKELIETFILPIGMPPGEYLNGIHTVDLAHTVFARGIRKSWNK